MDSSCMCWSIEARASGSQIIFAFCEVHCSCTQIVDKALNPLATLKDGLSQGNLITGYILHVYHDVDA